MKQILLSFTAILFTLMQLPVSAQVFSPNAEQHVLLEIAAENDKIRVIITYDLPFTAAGDDQPGLLNQQRAAIASTTYQILERNQDAGFESVRTYNNLPHMAMTTDRRGLIALFNDPDVRDVQLDEPSAPSMSFSNGIIGSPVIWDLGFTGEGMVVAVLDTGVEASHTHFGGRVVAEACFSTTFADFGSTTLCPDGNNPTGADLQIGPGAGDDCDTSIFGCGHGTHVAGTVAGSSTNDGRAIDGVAKDANILAIQVFSRFPVTSCGAGATTDCVLSYPSDQIAGLDWVFDLRNDFNIVSANMSLGGGQNFDVCDDAPQKPAMDQLKSANIATIVASGNNGYKNAISAPACISTAISVGSSETGNGGTTEDNTSWFSNSAHFLDLLAPGHFIESSTPNGNYSSFAGTSMAAPHVAGAWALYRQAFPDATVDEVLEALKDHGVPLTDTNGITKPRIQIDASMLNTETVAELTGTNAGWRQLGSPIQNTTYSDMFSSIWTQGFTGANVEFGTSNIYVYNESTRLYTAPADALHIIGSASTIGDSGTKSLLVYVFEDDDYDGIPEAWPKPLNVTGVPNIGNKVVTFSRTEMGDGAEGWHMVSNPFPYTLNWSSVFADATNMHANAYVWDANRDGGADYIHAGLGGIWDGNIAPFQGFWVRATANGGTITFKAEHASATDGDLFHETNHNGLKLIVSNGDEHTWTGIYFDDDKAQSPEMFNAVRLSSLSPDFLHLFSSDETMNTSWKTQFLSDSDFTSKTIPLHLHSTESGHYSLKVSDFIIPHGFKIELIDNQTKITMPVDEYFVYDFVVDEDDAIQTHSGEVISPLDWLNHTNLTVSLNEESPENRFSLIINQVFTTTETDQDLPSIFRLSQNYPNPFNPTTRIEYDLPTTSDVRLEVFNIAGQRIATLVSETQSAGTHSVSFDASQLSSGVYIYRMEAGNFVQTQKMTLIK